MFENICVFMEKLMTKPKEETNKDTKCPELLQQAAISAVPF